MINIYTQEQIERLHQSGKILSEVLKALKKEIKIGISLNYLDSIALKLIKSAGAKPAFLGYRPEGANYGYPASICASLNQVVVHGVPSGYKLKSGDLLKIDCGVNYKGYYSDSAFSIIVGSGNNDAKNLVKATQKALEEAIKSAKPGNHIGDIGFTIEKTGKKFGVNVIQGLTGHGVGKDLHEEPTVYNYGNKGQGIELKPGMVFAIEPMFSIGSGEIKQLPDESWATIDNSLTAQFEHTIAITEKGVKILTE